MLVYPSCKNVMVCMKQVFEFRRVHFFFKQVKVSIFLTFIYLKAHLQANVYKTMTYYIPCNSIKNKNFDLQIKLRNAIIKQGD